VQVNPDGSTATGWGGATFISKYRKRGFDVRRARAMFDRKQTPFALVMRSLWMVCLDIDGKNGGIESAAALNLPLTLAETSKSGNGYHLFYLVDDTWNPTFGFDRLRDRIGWRKGIDIRATGCVYHYPSQRWNTAVPVQLPDAILIDLEQTRDDQVARAEHITTLRASTDPDDQMEFLMLQSTIQSKLDAPIAAGKRNNTLFAIGSEMKLAGITGWSEQVYNRAVQLGLDDEEAAKLVGNIDRYAV
jgi:Bifunctional DNA primase/polymerase, N-terminal